jgi:hypothetical protein
MEIRHTIEFVTVFNDENTPSSIKAHPQLEEAVKATNLAVLMEKFLPLINEGNSYAELRLA